MQKIQQALNNIAILLMNLASRNRSFHLVLSYIKDDGTSDSIGITNAKDLKDLAKMKADTNYNKYIVDFLQKLEPSKFSSINKQENGTIIFKLK